MSMMNTIRPAVRTVVDYTMRKPLKALSETKALKYVCKQYQADNVKFMSAIGVSSIVLKDGFGCYLYVKQSLNNEKIPADKRKFVAALDLANGGLMIAMQLLMFFTVSNKKVQSWMFNKLFGKYFKRPATKSLQALLNKNDKLQGINGENFHKALGKYKKDINTAFGCLTALVASSIFGKRVVVPFIATPLADKTKAWMSRNDKPAQLHKDTKNTYDTEEKDIIKPDSEKAAPQNIKTQEAGNNQTNLLAKIKNK